MLDNYLNGIDYAIIGLYLAVLVVLGLRLKTRASAGLEQYLLGNRSMPWWMLGLSGVMDFWDLAGTMIIVSFLFLLGPRGLFIEFRGGAVLVLALQMLWAGKWHRRSGCLTAAEWMLFRFGDGPAGQAAQLARAIAGIVLTLGTIAYLVKGAGLFLSVFVPYSPAQCAFVVVASATVYSMFSGFYGVVIIHVLQLGIVLAAMAAIAWLSLGATSSVGELATLAEQVTGNTQWVDAAPTLRATMPAGYEAYESLLLLATLYLLRNVVFGMGAGDDPKYFAARSDADCGKFTLLWTCVMSLRWPMALGLAVLGLAVVRQLFPDLDAAQQAAEAVRAYHADGDWATITAAIAHAPEVQPPVLVAQLHAILGDDWPTRLQLVSELGTINPERIMPAVLLYAIPPGLRSLMVVSLIAAAMAGFGALVNQAAGFFTHDIYQKHLRPAAQVRELMVATWTFVAALVASGFLFAFSARNLNDVWAWIIMGLGSGMMFPQMLPLYWRRFTGVGYTVGMIAGVAAALAQRAFGSMLPESWQFLNAERWLLPIIGLVGLTASVVGSLASRPTADDTLQRFYLRTLPFGLWGPDRRQLPAALAQRVAGEHRREIAALPLALVFQTTAFLTPMMALIRNWPSLAWCAGIMAASFAGLYAVWLRRIDESDGIAAEARRLLEGDSAGASAAGHAN